MQGVDNHEWMSETTSDLCDRFAEQAQILLGDFRHFGGAQAFYGSAKTISCFEDNSLVGEALRSEGQGRVLVVDGGASMRRALLGDNLAAAGIENGWSGIVINGCVRDVEIIKDMPFGVFALGSIPMKTEKRGLGDYDVSLNFGSVTIESGDFVACDLTGVVVLSKTLYS